MGKATKFAVGTAIAAGVGYVAGILTAPKSGKETRKELHDKAAKARLETEKRLKKLNTDLSELIAKAKARSKNAEATAKAELRKLLDNAVVAKEHARDILSAFHEGESDDRELQKAVDEVHSAIDHLKKYLEKDAKTQKTDK